VHNEKYMHRCLELASLGKGNVSPNPMVGAVLVCDDQIIGEGYHKEYGSAHAEVNAINSVQNTDLLGRSTLYVNLEPCAHQGITPPCADLIVQKGIPTVVIANKDPNELVAGRGIARLKEAGVEVHCGILEKEGEELNRFFFTRHRLDRSYIVLKWAETADGFIGRNSSTKSETRQISGKMSQIWLHQQRAEIDAILVGVNTVLEDNPALTTRLVPGKSPLRFVIDTKNRIPDNSRIIEDDLPVIVLSNRNEEGKNYKKVDCSEEGVYPCLLRLLNENQCLSLMVEGGAITLRGFIEHNLWDEACVLHAHKVWVNGIPAPKLNLEPRSQTHLEDTELIQYLRPK